MNATARDKAWDSAPASGSEAVSLVESAILLRWRAPELALVLADRAVRAVGEHRPTVLRAEHLAVVALNRLGRYGEAAQRLLPVIQDDDVPAELRHELQIELAQCAVDLGEPATALAALHPVLAAGEDIGAALRGTALVAAVEALGALGRADDLSATLEEADELFREDARLDRDTSLLLRAIAKAAGAVRHRRGGAARECEEQARAGRELLAELADPEHDSGQVSGRLMLETVLALLDRGEGEVAEREARRMLRRPVRAAAAGAVGWLRLAIATRVHLAEGRHEPALALLADAVEVTQRHGVDAVLAECLEGLSHVHEARGEFADALHCLRSARAAEGRHRRTTETARTALVEHCGVARREVAGLVDQVVALLPDAGSSRAVSDHARGVLDAEEYASRLEAALSGSASLSQVFFAVGSVAGAVPDRRVLVEVSRRLQALVPPGGALGQLTDDRFAVLLPATSDTEAQSWADRLRAGLAAELGPGITVGVAQRRAGHGIDQSFTEASGASRTAASERQPTGSSEPEEVAGPSEAVGPDEKTGSQQDPRAGLRPADTMTQPSPRLIPLPDPTTDGRRPTASEPIVTAESLSVPEVRRRRGANGTPVLVSDLLPGSVLSSGRSGRRRAEDRVEEPPVEEPPVGTVAEPPVAESPVEELPAAGPPVEGALVEGAPVEGAPVEGAPVEKQPVQGPPVVGPLVEEQPVEEQPVEEPSSEEPQAEKPPPAEDHRTGTEDSGQAGDHQPEDHETATTGHIADLSPPPVGGAAPSLAPFEPSLAPFDVLRGPPTAPIPRALGWGFNGSRGDPESTQVGMGDLLAEALAAFREGRRPDPLDRRRGTTSEALTDPELRLPDLTAEPRWQRPGDGPQSAAGD